MPVYSAELLVLAHPFLMIFSRNRVRYSPAVEEDAVAMKDQKSDEEVIEAVLTGDTNAYRILIERHQAYIKSTVRRYVPAADIEDAAQEAFVEAYRNLKTFRRESSFRTWIRVIAVRRCYDLMAKRYRNQEVQSPNSTADYHDWIESVGAGDSLVRYSEDENLRHAKETLRWALGRLSPEDRMIVILLHLEDRTVEEIAKTLGQSKLFVRVRAHRARNRLKKVLLKLLARDN